MREHKYRAWSKKYGIMEEVDGMHLYIADGLLYEVYESSHHYDTYMSKKDVTDEYIIMEFIGRIDRDGIEIYEGDILGDTLAYGEVVWVNEESRFGISYNGDVHDIYLADVSQNELIVIGNKHRFPELLEMGDR